MSKNVSHFSTIIFRYFRLLLVISIILYIFYSKSESGSEPKIVPETKRYVIAPLGTVHNGGGLGNQLFEAFSLLGIAQKLGRTAAYTSENPTLIEQFKFLHRIFPTLRDSLIAVPIDNNRSAEHKFPTDCCKYFLNSSLENETAKFLLIDGYYLQSFKYFENIRSYVFEMLKPDENFRKIVSDRVEAENVQKYKTCVHVRRGDFIKDKVHEGTNATFARNAIKFLNQGRKNGMFFIFSNDPDWVSTNIVSHLDAEINVEIMKTPGNRAIEDLYFSQIWCDSVLITVPSSTFGWWMSYLSKNQKEVYYRDIFETNDRVKNEMNKNDFYPPEWNEIGMDSEGNIEIKHN